MTFDQFKAKIVAGEDGVNSPEHDALLKHVKRHIKRSRKDMAKHYKDWDEYDAVFRSRRRIDKEDIENIKKGNTPKMIVPLTYSQVLTFVAFAIMSITQNQRFFELEPTGREDDVLTEPLELILERDLRRNQWNAFLVQFFLDIGRFCLGAAEVCYKEEFRYMRITQTNESIGAFGTKASKTTSDFKKLPYFVGNKVYPVSPYHFFPDTSLPLTRYQEGEFCGSEDVFSYASLQSQDVLFNLDNIPKFTPEGYKKFRKHSRANLGDIVDSPNQNPNLGEGTGDHSSKVQSGDVIVTKICFDLNPAKFKNSEEDKPWFDGDNDFPIRYIVWYANDKTIIRFEEAYYLHGQFPYIAAQYIPDQHELVNDGIAAVCDQLTSLVTWKINAHMASQRNSVMSKYVVDPAGIDVKNLDSNNPYIFLRKNASQTGVDRYIKQFKTEDTTMATFKDVGDIETILEKVTGLSAQLQGQYSQGRRSATQDRVVAQGSSARGKTTLSGVWDTAFEPLGKQLMINNRQEMDFDTFSRIVGKREWPINEDAPPQGVDPQTGQPIPTRYTTEEVFSLFKATPEDLVQSEDFFVYDGTLPSEKAFLAQSLQEIFTTILSNPIVAQTLGIGPEFVKELFNQIYLLRGVTPARLPALTPVPPAAPVPTGVPPVAPPAGGPPQIAALPSPTTG